MRRKNIFLIVFTLTLFVFQQVQAGGSVEKKSEVNVPLTTFTGWGGVVFIKIFPLDMNTGTIVGSKPCDWTTNNEPGCGPSAPLFTGTVYQDLTVDCNDKPQNPYPRKNDPNDPNGYYYLCIDGDYLPDVLPTEMNLGQIRPPEPEALMALAVAARTFIKYKAPNGEIINNSSTSYQVYVPWSSSVSYSDGSNYQNEIVSAVNLTSGQYLSYNDNVIDAEYSSEIFDATQDGGQEYLKSVQEPISSSSCSTQGATGNSWGISQRGAIRWAKGSTCPDESGTAWPINGVTPIKWDYKQILVHYYTKVSIVGTNTPNDRWNLLKYENIPPTATPGQTITNLISLQNTSTQAWNNAVLGYRWTGANGADTGWVETSAVLSTAAGDDETLTNVGITAPNDGNSYDTLHLDVKVNGHWISLQSPAWPDATIAINVVGGPTTTPTITPTVTATNSSSGVFISCKYEEYGCEQVDPYTIHQHIDVNWGLHQEYEGVQGAIGVVFNLAQSAPLYIHVEDAEFSVHNLDLEYEKGFGHFYFLRHGENTGGSVVSAYMLQTNHRIGADATDITVDPVRDFYIAQMPNILPGWFYFYSHQDWGVENGIRHEGIQKGDVWISTIPIPTPTPTPTKDPCQIELVSTQQPGAFDIQLLHRVKNEILSQTSQGQHYTDLYYSHGPEIIQILSSDSDLTDEAVTTLQLWEPNLQALVDGQGSSVTITGGQVQAVQTFLDHLYAAGSTELRQTIDDEGTLHPLEQTIGMTMDQAADYLIDYQPPITETPTPTETSTSTPSATPTLTFTPTLTTTPTITSTLTSTQTRTPTPTITSTPSFTPTFTASPTSTLPASLIFADGFESGNFSAWYWAATDGGDLSVSNQAAAVGNYGMQAFFDDGHELVVYDETPNSEKHYSARFYFDPNSMQLTSQTGFYMLGINSGSTWGAACLYFEQQGDYYSLGLCGKNDAGTWFQSVPVLLADEWQSVEVEWKAATAPGVNNGYIKLWIGDQLSSAIENLDSDSQAITQASWGPSDSSFIASGSMYFDAFESRRGEHIGLDANGPAVSPPSARPDVIFSDDFESGNFSDWNPTLNVLDGGDLSVSASAAHQGGYGMQALIDDTTALKVVDSSPAAENHYRARFYFHPNSISMNSGSAHFIFDGIDNYYDWVLFRLELLYESGVYKIRPRVMTDIYTNINGSKYAISNGWHVIEIDWKKSTAPGANNGYLSLWIDGALAGTISNVDNDSLNNLLDEVRLGATAGIDSTTSGSMLFDQFVSHRQTYIGP